MNEQQEETKEGEIEFELVAPKVHLSTEICESCQ